MRNQSDIGLRLNKKFFLYLKWSMSCTCTGNLMLNMSYYLITLLPSVMGVSEPTSSK